jgi:hypothetical protein
VPQLPAVHFYPTFGIEKWSGSESERPSSSSDAFIYYARNGGPRTESATQGPEEQVSKSTKQVKDIPKGQSSALQGPAPHERISQRPTSTPSLSLTPSGQSSDQKRTQRAQVPLQESGRPVAPAKPAPTTVSSAEPPRLKPLTFSPMPPPPRPTNGTGLRLPPSAASMLRVPPTKVLSNSSMAPSSLMPPPSKPSRKVVLAPGHSPLDWGMLTSNPNHKLRGKDVPDNLIRVSASMLKYHNGRKGRDAWTEYQGKV